MNRPDSAIITYQFTVDVVSGRLIGKKYEGYFSYDSSQLNCNGNETIEVFHAGFKYQGVNYTKFSFDRLPTVHFKNGQFQCITAVGGSGKRRFQFDAGSPNPDNPYFWQPQEAFVREGQPFFFYLDPGTFIEGTGRVTYIQELEPDTTCKPSDELTVDLTKLHDLLEAGEWKEADSETGRVILQAVGQLERGWLTDDDIENFPDADLRAIDQFWLQYSEGRFGLSVQKQIWQEVGEDYLELSDRVGWRLGDDWLNYEDLEFSTKAPMGHLPFVGTCEAHEDWNDQWPFVLPFVLPLWVSRSRPFVGRLTPDRSREICSEADLLKVSLLRTLLERI